MSDINERIVELAYIKARCLQDNEFFTKYMFKNETGKKFTVRKHHRMISQKLNEVLEGKCKRLIINIAPRLGKTEIAVKKFIAQGFAINASSRFMHLSYSDDLAMDNSNFIRDLVQQDFYKELFPNVQLKADSNSKKKWYTTKGGMVYATSTGGQVTGFGAGDTEDEEDFDKELTEIQKESKYLFSGALIIDDPIKPEDADSDLLRERINERFTSTILNRINSQNTPIIIIMQRLHERDLCGYLLSEHSEENWDVLSIPALQVDEEGNEYSIWESKISAIQLQTMRAKKPYIFERQYMQSPVPKEGRLYGEFMTYETLPITKMARRKNYTDVADKGKDYLCSICFVQTEIGNYVTDVLFTKASTANTEPMVVRLLNKNQTERARIESNNGGTIFARNVRNQLRITGNHRTYIEEFHQQGNKESRIISNKDTVMNMVYFPANWAEKWPEFYTQLTAFRAEGNNAHDDAPDALTGVVEMAQTGSSLISISNIYANN